MWALACAMHGLYTTDTGNGCCPKHGDCEWPLLYHRFTSCLICASILMIYMSSYNSLYKHRFEDATYVTFFDLIESN